MLVIFNAVSMLLLLLLQEISAAEVPLSSPMVSATDLDEVDMLQGEVWSKIRAADASKASRSVKDAAGEGQEQRKLKSEACMAALDAKAPVTIMVAEDAGAGVLRNDLLIGGEPSRVEEDALEILSPASEPQTGMYCCVFRYLLDLSVLAIVVDGIRRWRQADGVKDCTPAHGHDSWKAFMAAAAAGDAARCTDLLRRGLSVTETDLWGCTVLHAAARGGLEGVVQEVLASGADVNQPDTWDETPLHLAARGGHAEACEALLSRAAQVDAPNAQNFTPLVVAGQEGHRATCLLLMKHGAGVAGLPASELPPVLAALLPRPAPAEEQLQDDEEEAAAEAARRQWPTAEDWEEHMKESVPDS